MDSSLLECSEQINFEASPEVKASPATGAQMDDAAALLLMLGAGREEEASHKGPPALTLPQSHASAFGHGMPAQYKPQATAAS